MQKVISKDGTPIAYEKAGSGPVVILIIGALGVHHDPEMVSLLKPHFTVINVDRRGRGASGDTKPYAAQREVEDIEALIDTAGGSAYLVGGSSGGVLALEVATKLPSKVKKLLMYEPPLIVDDSRPPVPVDYVAQVNAAIAAGDRSGAVEIFMTKALLIPAEFVDQMKTAPMGELFEGEVKPPAWAEMEKVAHTLAYDGMILEGLMLGKPLPPKRWAANTADTLVLVGGNSDEFFHNGAQALVEDLPNAKYSILEGQDHAVAPSALAPVIIEFFKN